MSIIAIAAPYKAKAKFWIDELPDLPATSSDVVEERRQIAYSPTNQKDFRAAIEVLIPLGGRFIYGLLASEYFRNTSTNELVVQVANCAPGPIITESSLARGLDAVESGIPVWASNEILKTAFEAAEGQRLGAGYLRFASGAHGKIGSNIWVFGGLARALVELTGRAQMLFEKEELSNLLRRHLW
jgi:hypothetical protein